ncbi:MAG: TolC family protein [Flammeovirgaceae bacterium]
MNKYLILFYSLLWLNHAAWAQEKPLALPTALQALEKNAHILQQLDKDLALSKEHQKMSKQYYLPQVGLQYTGIFTNSPLNAFGFKLNQQIVEQADFTPSLLNNPDVISNFNSKIQVMQPIFNADAVLHKDRIQHQIEALTLQKTHTLHHLQLQLKQSYTQLQLLYASRAVLLETEKALKTHEENVVQFIQQGVGKLADQLAIQVEINTIANQRIRIDKHVKQVSSHIAYLTGDQANSVYQPSTEMEKSTTATLFLSDSVPVQRADLLALQKGIEAQYINRKITKAQELPRLNAFGEFNFNDNSPVGFGGSNFLVGFSLSWRLHLGQQLKSKVASQQLAIEKAHLSLAHAKAQSNQQLQQAIATRTALRAQLKNQETTIELATEQLRIMKNRFQEGLEKSADVLVAENKLAQVKLGMQELRAQLQQQHDLIEFLVREN